MRNKTYIKPKVKNTYAAKAKMQKDFVIAAHSTFMLLGLMVLRDMSLEGTLTFEKSEAKRFKERYDNLLEEFLEGRVSVDDLNETILEETGIEVLKKVK